MVVSEVVRIVLKDRFYVLKILLVVSLGDLILGLILLDSLFAGNR